MMLFSRRIRSALLLFSLPVVVHSAFAPFVVVVERQRTPWQMYARKAAPSLLQHAAKDSAEHVWLPQDLTQNVPGYAPLPDSDYIKLYQNNPELWPVEFFFVVHRRLDDGIEVLVRKSANGTSQWGLGTGVPVTRWILEGQGPPIGYQVVSNPRVSFEARNFPEFPTSEQSWTYEKVDLVPDAFDDDADLVDPELESYSREIRDALQKHMSQESDENKNSWQSIRMNLIKHILDQPNSVAAIQGTLRMSGIFAKGSASENDSSCRRYMSLINPPDPDELARSMRVYTMFPQMPHPMPLPSALPLELQKELETRDARMAKTGRSPHHDDYGRIYTHRSTSNVSNTIHGIYLTLDATEFWNQDDNVPPALDLFGTQSIPREWKSLQDLKVLDASGDISTEDPKPTFISGFIVRQLVREGVIDIQGKR